MALSKLVFKPGVNRDQTNYASEGGWYSMDKVRFRSGFPEKIGGWQVKTLTPFVGTARSLFSWSSTDGAQLLGIGTNIKQYINVGSNLLDITPIRTSFVSPATDNCFATTSGSNVVTVTIVGHGADDGAYVTFSGVTGTGSPANVGGILITELNAEFAISNVTSSTFTITTTTSANATVATGGGTAITAAFQINPGVSSPTAGYGWGTGTWGRGAWGSGSTSPFYAPAQLIFQDNNTNDLVYNIRYGNIYYWTYTNPPSGRAVALSSISGAIAVPTDVNMVMFAPSGHLLALGCTSYSPSISAGVTISSITHSSTTATATTSTSHGLATGDWVQMSGQVPVNYAGLFQVTVSNSTVFTYTMLANPGANAATVGSYVEYTSFNGSYDPLLVRWANVDTDQGPQPEVWNPTTTNTAGFIRLDSGTEIYTAYNTRQETLIWTDTALTSLQFLGTEEVFGKQELSHTITIMGPNVVAEANNIVFWMGLNKFYVYSGRVDTLPCTLRQYIFNDINTNLSSIFFAGTNAEFNEVIWFYVSNGGTEINRYVIYNYADNIWYYGTLHRTAWIDTSIIDNPLATANGWVYNHEVGVDDGQPLGAAPLPIEAFIQSADVDIEDGDKFMLVRRVIPDVNFNGSQSNDPVTGAVNDIKALITVGVRNFPGAASSTTNLENQTTAANVITSSATIDQYTNQVFIRARGRQMNFRIASSTVGTQWQLGMPRVDARPDGLRS